MPAPTTTQELLDLVRKSELIPPQRLEAFITQATAARSAATPRELAQLLIAAGLATQFQADQFLQGKWRGFTIGKYKVLERIGSGGMGTVYLCEHVSVGRKVAIKVLPTSQADNPSALGRFYREARAAGVLDHPNLVKAHDVDQDGGLHYLVMDYVDGSSLQDIVARHGALAVPRACNYIRQAAIGLQAAFGAGLIHRDVKPANIMLERNGTIRVLDLGLARFFHDNVDPLTLKYDDRNVLGTADYVAPEQALNSHEVDVRADIYSLGGTFYFLLTGQPPFPGGKVAQKLIWHQVRQPTPVQELRHDVPDEVAAIVMRMMAKSPAQRYQTPAEVVEVLEPFTVEPVARPRTREMPRLSPAAANQPYHAGSVSQRPHAAISPAPVPARAVAVGGPGSDRMVGLDKTAAPADLATPRALTDSAPTDTEEPRTTRPMTPPSRFLEDLADPVESAPLAGWKVSAVWLGVFALLSAGAGVLLSVWMSRL